MRGRERIYGNLGYKVEYLPKREKFRGFPGPLFEPCIATDPQGNKFYCFADRGGKTHRAMKVQDSIRHMARISEPSTDHVLVQVAPGELVWHLDKLTSIEEIARQLYEFAADAKLAGICHRDIRPWNVFIDEKSIVTVIDWDLSDGNASDIDRQDVDKFLRLMKGEIDFNTAWSWTLSWYPAWCRH